MGVKSQFRLIRSLAKMELKSAMEYRFNFIIQTVGMILNDLFWIFFWFIFFSRFSSINGWTFKSMLFLHAVVLTSWGLAFTLFGNLRGLAKMIEEGQLDYYLSLPKEILSHLAIKLRYSTVGDLILGVVLFVIVIPVLQWPLAVSLIVASALIFASFSILVNSITFFAGKFERAARVASDIMLTFAMYPFSVYHGFAKFVLLFIIPAGFAAGVPVNILQNFSLPWYIGTLVFSVCLFVLAVFLFYLGLKKYESGNMMGARI